jgi:hypothetical protein
MNRALVVLVMTLCAAACAGGGGSGAATQPEGDPYITGEITSVAPFVPVTESCVDPAGADPDGSVSSDDPPFCSTGDEAAGTILVEEQPDGNKASLQVTAVWRQTADGLEAAAFADLQEGQTVSAWVSGPVAESFPVQATADAIVITGG